MPGTNAARKIRDAQRRNELTVLRFIENSNKAGVLWRPSMLLSAAWCNALDRLQARGYVVYAHRKNGIGGYRTRQAKGRLK